MPKRTSWIPRPPAAPTPATADDDEEGGLSGRAWHRSRIIGVDLDHAVIHDVSVTGCDVAAVLVRSGGGQRIAVSDTRIRDVGVPGARLRDVTVADVQAERLSVRFAHLTSVSFLRCTLTGADFTGTTFDHVTFDHCDLTGARFDAAVVTALRTSAVTFTGVTGAASLAGATIAPADLLTLAAPLAVSVGIRLADEVHPSTGTPGQETGPPPSNAPV